MAASRHSSDLATPLKITLSLLTAITLASAAWFAVPPAAGALLSGAPKLWSSTKAWLAPPYLFIAVHLIIAVIWKLSDYQKHWDNWSTPPEPQEKPENAAKARALDDPPAPLFRNPSPDLWQEITPPSLAIDDSKLNSAPPPVPELKMSSAAAPPAETKTEMVSVSAAELEEDEEEENHESMDDMWRAIMEKSPRARPGKAAAASKVVLPTFGEGHDEMDRKFDRFIKGKRDQLRLERHESNQRRLLGAGAN